MPAAEIRERLRREGVFQADHRQPVAPRDNSRRADPVADLSPPNLIASARVKAIDGPIIAAGVEPADAKASARMASLSSTRLKAGGGIGAIAGEVFPAMLQALRQHLFGAEDVYYTICSPLLSRSSTVTLESHTGFKFRAIVIGVMTAGTFLVASASTHVGCAAAQVIAAAKNNDKYSASPSPAATISKLVVDNDGVVFLLDDAGDVWAFTDPWSFKGKFKLKGLSKIRDIEPYIALDYYGKVYQWDAEVSSSDELNFKVRYKPPRLQSAAPRSIMIASGGLQYASATSDGRVYQWRRHVGRGDNPDFAQFLGTETPAEVLRTPFGIQGIAVSGYNVVVLKGDNVVVGWGVNNLHQLGADSRRFVDPQRPAEFAIDGRATKIAATYQATFVLTDDGLLRQWGGCSDNGKLIPGSVANGRVATFKGIRNFAVDPVASWKPYVLQQQNGDIWLAYPALPAFERPVGRTHSYDNFCDLGGHWLEHVSKVSHPNLTLKSLAYSASTISSWGAYMVDAEGRIWAEAQSSVQMFK
jgi:hypothetical protein